MACAGAGALAGVIRSRPIRDRAPTPGKQTDRNLSALAVDPRTGHLLALSDQSKLLLELDSAGKPVSSLSLFAGRHGLSRNVPQAEGVASDNAGNLYLISEPNLFYVFRKP